MRAESIFGNMYKSLPKLENRDGKALISDVTTNPEAAQLETDFHCGANNSAKKNMP